MHFGKHLRHPECAERQRYDPARCKFFLVGFIDIVEFRKLDCANCKHPAEHKERWRSSPRHEQPGYDGARDKRPRLIADPIRIGIAKRSVAIDSDPSRNIVFRRPRYTTC
jgi:hypothetical protein